MEHSPVCFGARYTYCTRRCLPLCPLPKPLSQHPSRRLPFSAASGQPASQPANAGDMLFRPEGGKGHTHLAAALARDMLPYPCSVCQVTRLYIHRQACSLLHPTSPFAFPQDRQSHDGPSPERPPANCGNLHWRGWAASQGFGSLY